MVDESGNTYMLMYLRFAKEILLFSRNRAAFGFRIMLIGCMCHLEGERERGREREGDLVDKCMHPQSCTCAREVLLPLLTNSEDADEPHTTYRRDPT
jgi:hypothetical protein